MIGLSFAAAATSTIGIATGVLLLPEHNPVVVAKQAATLDTLSGGRFTLGVGIGWSREEFDALGVPFERRGDAHRRVRRGDAHAVARRRRIVRRRVRAVRLGADEPETRWGQAYSDSRSEETATPRCAVWSHGPTAGTGSTSTVCEAVAERMAFIERLCDERGRDRSELRVTVALRELQLRDVPHWRSSASTNWCSSTARHETRRVAADWVSALAERWMPALR